MIFSRLWLYLIHIFQLFLFCLILVKLHNVFHLSGNLCKLGYIINPFLLKHGKRFEWLFLRRKCSKYRICILLLLRVYHLEWLLHVLYQREVHQSNQWKDLIYSIRIRRDELRQVWLVQKGLELQELSWLIKMLSF